MFAKIDPSERQDYAAMYLAALLDGEGHIGFHPRRDSGVNRSIVIGMSDKSAIDTAERCFYRIGVNGVRFSCPRGKYKTMHYIEIRGRDNFEKVAIFVPMQIESKKQTLAVMIASFLPVTCSVCGCHKDEMTKGCPRCYTRHRYRSKVADKGMGKSRFKKFTRVEYGHGQSKVKKPTKQ